MVSASDHVRARLAAAARSQKPPVLPNLGGRRAEREVCCSFLELRVFYKLTSYLPPRVFPSLNSYTHCFLPSCHSSSLDPSLLLALAASSDRCSLLSCNNSPLSCNNNNNPSPLCVITTPSYAHVVTAPSQNDAKAPPCYFFALFLASQRCLAPYFHAKQHSVHYEPPLHWPWASTCTGHGPLLTSNCSLGIVQCLLLLFRHLFCRVLGPNFLRSLARPLHAIILLQHSPPASL